MQQVPFRLKEVPISLYLIWFFLYSVASNLVSLEVSNMFIQRGKTDIEIRCVVNCSNFTVIQLMRSNESIVSSSSRRGIQWQDLELKNRSEAKSNATCSDNDFIDLNMKIPSCMVNPLKDIGPYWCKVIALAPDRGLIKKDSQIVMLNITEGLEKSTSSRDCDEKGMLTFYRQIIIPTGIMISLILALVMVREVRMHYFQADSLETSKSGMKVVDSGNIENQK